MILIIEYHISNHRISVPFTARYAWPTVYGLHLMKELTLLFSEVQPYTMLFACSRHVRPLKNKSTDLYDFNLDEYFTAGVVRVA